MSSECLFLKHLVCCLRFLTVCIKSSVKRIVRSRKKKRTNFKHLLVFHLTARNAPHSLNETSCANIDTWTQLMVFDTKVSDAGSWLLEPEFSSLQHKSPRAKSTTGHSYPGQSLGQGSSASTDCPKEQEFQLSLDSLWCLVCWWAVKRHKVVLKTAAFLVSQLQMHIPHMQVINFPSPCGQLYVLKLRDFECALVSLSQQFLHLVSIFWLWFYILCTKAFKIFFVKQLTIGYNTFLFHT